MNTLNLNILIDFVSNTKDDKQLVDTELKHGCINTRDLLNSESDIELYKENRNSMFKYLNDSGIYRFLWSLNTSNKNRSELIHRIIIDCQALHEYKRFNEILPLWLSVFLVKGSGYLVYSIATIIMISILKYNYYSLSWYDFLLITMFGYIFVDKMNKYAIENDKIINEKKKQSALGIKNVIDRLHSILKFKFSYEELKKYSDCLSSIEFDKAFKYIQLKDLSYKDNSSLLETANATIRKANIRVSELKSEIESHKETINYLADKITELELSSVKKEKEKGKEINDLLNKIIELEQVINSNPNYSPYEILGLKFGETNKKLIKSNYIKLSNIYHFDRSGSNEMMKKINIAYDKLK